MRNFMAIIYMGLLVAFAVPSALALELPPQNIQLTKSNTNMTKVLSAQYRSIYDIVNNKYLYLRDYWYDTFEEGE